MFNRIQSSFFGMDLTMQVTGNIKFDVRGWKGKSIIVLALLEMLIGKRQWVRLLKNKLISSCIRFEVINHGKETAPTGKTPVQGE